MADKQVRGLIHHVDVVQFLRRSPAAVVEGDSGLKCLIEEEVVPLVA